MIAFAGMLVSAAEQAGMKVPPDPDQEINRHEYPHFFVFAEMQIGSAMPSMGCHWDNAKIIAALSEEEVKSITPQRLINKGFQIGYNLA